MDGDSPHILEIDGQAVTLRLRRSARARRVSLRIDHATGEAVLVLPARMAEARGLRFAAEHVDWLRRRLAALPPRVPFAEGAVLPLLGADHVVRHRPEQRRGVWTEAGAINVSGRAEHLARRLRDWLRHQALAETSTRAHAMAAGLGRRIAAVAVRDTRSRWGSCTAEGRLAFSWRLLLCPEAVLDYVVAHEVAHLAHLDHGPAFWRLVDDLAPGSETARRWLRRHGPALHRYG